MHAGAQIGASELRDGFVESLPQAGRARGRALQIEDRGSDLLDDFLKIVHALGKPLLHFGSS